jgi:hypothetical protein
VKQSCSWCHHENERGVEFCRHCGHCAGIPRMQCYCSQCRQRLPMPTSQAAELCVSPRAGGGFNEDHN